jgi:hypothetical protein
LHPKAVELLNEVRNGFAKEFSIGEDGGDVLEDDAGFGKSGTSRMAARKRETSDMAPVVAKRRRHGKHGATCFG